MGGGASIGNGAVIRDGRLFQTLHHNRGVYWVGDVYERGRLLDHLRYMYLDQINTSYATLSSRIPWNIPRGTCIFSVYERALHNYFIPCHKKVQLPTQSMGHTRGAHEKVGCNTVE